MSNNGANIKNFPELDNYQLWQAERFNNILDMPIINPEGELESGADELNRLAEWIEAQSEQQRHETEREFWYKSF